MTEVGHPAAECSAMTVARVGLHYWRHRARVISRRRSCGAGSVAGRGVKVASSVGSPSFELFWAHELGLVHTNQEILDSCEQALTISQLWKFRLMVFFLAPGIDVSILGMLH